MNADEQARAAALDELAEQIMREFYLSSDYNPLARRHADTVKAAILFALCTQQAKAE